MEHALTGAMASSNIDRMKTQTTDPRKPGRVALVTGASRNIGREIALALSRDGCTVWCLGRDAAALDETRVLVQEAGGAAHLFIGDAAQPETLEAFAALAVREHGRIDVVVNNAGAVREVRTSQLTPAQFLEDLQLNLVSQFALARAAYDSLKATGAGVIVNIGSIAGALGFPRAMSYCASKAGIEGMTRSLALDWARDGIRVLCVAPGYVESGVSAGALANDTARQWILERIPQRRLAGPADIAAFVAFLASPSASFATGETYTVDGGLRSTL
jgi:NAD(P)-dependent dehydrogenase (short-subunit alcohol dehydrogenase family)